MTSISADDPVTDANAGRDFWRRMLLAGSASRVPRWTLGRVAGQAERDIGIPLELSRRLERLGDELAVSLTSLWLAAHAKVLSALSGDGEVATGYSPEGRRGPLPCRLSTEASSWRALALKAHQVESELLAHKDFAVADLSRELRLVEAPFETVLDAAGEDDGELPEHVVLALSVCQDGGPRVRLRYRTDALDGACAARIAGYHLRALELMATEPEADHARHSLVWADEREFQIHGLAGPRRELPDRRVHELFEAQVRGRPDALAAVHGDTQWTYGQLNARANRLARALQARGLEREGVVAVVAERNLNWLAAVLAIFKAGGAYLPIEPHFPPDRIAKTLSRSGCGLVVSEPGSTETLDQALLALPQATAPSRLLFDEAWPEDHPDGDLGMEVAPGQLAYIYFTSGSTGEPKGAMCEHAGMLNHLYAKIDDLQIAAGSVVAQTAPQCFDISLWQLLCALLVGGRTLLIEQDAIMDAERFIDKIVGGRVGVLQVVPSYLEVLMSYLEQRPRELPDLRYVSVTGEALKKELAQRWFAAQPAIKLVNAYGLTETSDDTNHEVMDKPPSGERVPLGRPVNNVHVYVVDQNLLPVPLGAPGEIVFSGVCVGRGYVNDRERTQRAFMADPHRAAERLYRSGDYGRWRPDGKLEFLGRRDAQVKISGFRIEIGEIENALIRVGGVRDGAVIVTERGDKSKQLVAFYCADAPLDGAVVRERLAESLPEYMVPATCHWRQTLPLTANSKVDKKALRALARELDEGAPDRDRPSTPTEHRVAAAWAKVLGLPQKDIGRHDHFFDSGGTSLAAVKLAIALDRAVSFKDLTSHPVLGELAALIDRRSRQSEGQLQLLSHAEGQRTTAEGADVVLRAVESLAAPDHRNGKDS